MLLAAALLAASLVAHPPAGPSAGAPAGLEATQPKFILDLTLEEFSVLHSAAEHGVRTYGGHCEFKTDIFPSAEGMIWQVEISDPKLLPVWTQWMAEKTAELVSVTDIDRLSDMDRLAYRVTKSLTTKLKDAAGKPHYASLRYTGTPVAMPDGTLGFRLSDVRGEPTVPVIGKAVDELRGLVGRQAVLHGTMKDAGTLDALHAYPLREGVLEVFVISQCPFGKAAEKAIIERLAETATAGEAMPGVEFRYLFLPIDQTTTYTCMHGEGEVVENLVQMVIRDQFPDKFFPYLVKRAVSEAPWKEVAASVGFDAVATDYIAAEIVRSREPMMSAEYAYWKARGVQHESPTYFYEGRVVQSLDVVPGLKGIRLAAGSCGK
ncbi:MAG: hypothetical protein AB7K52_10180 [Phycisphaerales bacterium]